MYFLQDVPSPEDEHDNKVGDDSVNNESRSSRVRILRRPATTENAGIRPTRQNLPVRPKTAHDNRRDSNDQRTRLEILHTLLGKNVIHTRLVFYGTIPSLYSQTTAMQLLKVRINSGTTRKALR